MNSNNRTVGSYEEGLALDFLKEQGIRICDKNFRNRTGEIDLIGYDQQTLVFFEVKYRKNGRVGASLEAVGVAKQRQICKVAEFYLYVKHISTNTAIRYDVIGIDRDSIHWIKNAFYHIRR